MDRTTGTMNSNVSYLSFHYIIIGDSNVDYKEKKLTSRIKGKYARVFKPASP